jgi:ubiquinone/menaquinone biosynthesis C-methylase UbiE
MVNEVIKNTYPEDLAERFGYETEVYDEWYREGKRIERPFFYHNIIKEKCFIKSLINKFNVPRGSSLIDIACGNGMYSSIFHDYGMEVTGIDISKSAIEFCNKKYQGKIRFISGDAFSLDCENEFDYAFCSYFTFLNAFDTPQQCVQYGNKIMRYIKKQGILFFVWFSDLTSIRLPPDRFSIMNFTIKQLEEMFGNYRVESCAIDSWGRLPSILGKYSYNKWVTRLCCAYVQLRCSSWTRVRIILVVHK